MCAIKMFKKMNIYSLFIAAYPVAQGCRGGRDTALAKLKSSDQHKVDIKRHG